MPTIRQWQGLMACLHGHDAALQCLLEHEGIVQLRRLALVVLWWDSVMLERRWDGNLST